VTVRSRLLSLAILIAVAALCATAAVGSRTATPKRGGALTIARIEDSQSFDKTNVFQNESIWLAEQIMEPLYTVTPNGKNVKPWLATSYKVSTAARRTRSSCAAASSSRTARR